VQCFRALAPLVPIYTYWITHRKFDTLYKETTEKTNSRVHMYLVFGAMELKVEAAKTLADFL
jgi:hypothetical protein